MTSTIIDGTMHHCATLNQYAECLSNGTCKWKTLLKGNCITLIFLPGVHNLTTDLHVSKRGSLVMIKDSECSGDVEIHLDDTNIRLSCIAQLILAGFSIISNVFQNNLILMNVPHTCETYSIFKPSLIQNVNLSRSALVYECSGCTGNMSLWNMWFYQSYVNITTTNCHDLSIHIYCWHLLLDQSQTGLEFNSLQLKSVLIDSLETRDLSKQENSHEKPHPVYDLLFQSKSIRDLDLTIQNCSLERSESAGLLIKVIVAHNYQVNISISNSIISYHKHGGIMIIQPSKSTGKLNFTIENSNINYNHYSHDHYAAGLSVHSEIFNTTIVTLKHTEFRGNTDGRSRPIIVYIARAFHVLVENCSFTDNNGTAIQLNNVNSDCVPESFIFQGVVNFSGNSGYRGGALSLISAVISINPNTTLIFEDNTATDVGGAIFVDTNIPYNDVTDPDTLISCFYQFPMWKCDSKSYNITFSNNKAINGGNNIYGAPLNCYCTVFTGENETVRSINPSVTALFSISKNDYQSSVSSIPYRVCLTDSDDSIISACTNSTQIFNHEVTVYPGQEFSLEAVLVGFEFGQGTGTVNAQLLNHHSTEIWPEDSKFQRVETPTNTTLKYTLYSNDTSETVVLALTAEKISNIEKNLEEVLSVHEAVDEFNLTGVISLDLLTTPVYISVRFKPECPPGFELRQSPNTTTGCDTCKAIQSTYSGCHCLEECDSVMECLFDSEHEDGYLCLKKPIWVDIELDNSKMMYYKECPFDYCKTDLSDIIIDTKDNSSMALCDKNRGGKLCGQCIEGYSLKLGSNRCCRCSNVYIFLVAVFVVAGILLVAFIIVLNVTVAQGTINGFIFYANIVWAYNEIFFPRYDQIQFDFFNMFIAWVNLDFGIEVCFFDGLNAYWKTWLQFVFPVYIWIIAGIIIFLGRMHFFNQILPQNIVQVLATLVLLSYSKLLRTIITAFVPATIEIYSHGDIRPNDTLVVWKYDGEVEYGKYGHCMLLFAAFFALFFLCIPYTFILVFIKYTRNWRFIQKLMPFFEAYTGPLTPKCQFWVGLLLLVRCALLITLIFFEPDESILSMVVTIILIFILLYNTGSIYNNSTNIGKYRCYRFVPKGFQQLSFLSMLDISFLLNLVFLGVAMLYADFQEGNKNDAKAKFNVTYASIGIAMFQFIGIVIYPRFKELILDKYCIIGEEPEPEPISGRHQGVTHNSIDGAPPRDDEPLINNEDANNNADI